MKTEDGYRTSVAAGKAGVSVHRLRIYVQFGLVTPCKTTLPLYPAKRVRVLDTPQSQISTREFQHAFLIPSRLAT